MEYKFREYSPIYFKKLVDLITASFKIKNKKREELIHWKLFDPFLNGQTITYIALTPEDEVVGHYSSVPITLSKRNKDFKALACIDMTTDINHRRKGIISELAKRVYPKATKEGYELSIGFSNKEGVVVDKKAHGYGYTIVGQLSQYASLRLGKVKTNYVLVPTDTITSIKMNIDFFHVKRSTEYLNWRYKQKPGYSYDIFTVKGSPHKTLVVLKRINSKLYLYDIISEDFTPLHINEVIHSIINYAISIKTRIVIIPVLENVFWKEILTKNNFIKIPYTKHKFYLTVKILDHSQVDKAIFKSDNWIATNGDLW